MNSYRKYIPSILPKIILKEFNMEKLMLDLDIGNDMQNSTDTKALHNFSGLLKLL